MTPPRRRASDEPELFPQQRPAHPRTGDEWLDTLLLRIDPEEDAVQTQGVPLAAAVGALEVGNWRQVLYSRYAVEANEMALCRVLASSMRHQALGHPGEALQRLNIAARMLPRAMCRVGRSDTAQAVLRPKPTDGSPGQMLTWRASRLVWREQQELIDLQRRLRPLAKPYSQLIESQVEYLRWVEFDPWTSSDAPLPIEVGSIDQARADSATRASELRRFANPAAPEVQPRDLKYPGGYRSLRAQALRRLADAPPVPWQSENPMVREIPVRLGRLRAWRHATTWLEDLES